jgi:hypothetical protein
LDASSRTRPRTSLVYCIGRACQAATFGCRSGVFLAVYEQRATFEGRSSIKTWVCGVCVHKAANYRRAHARYRRRVKALAEDSVAVGTGLLPNIGSGPHSSTAPMFDMAIVYTPATRLLRLDDAVAVLVGLCRSRQTLEESGQHLGSCRCGCVRRDAAHGGNRSDTSECPLTHRRTFTAVVGCGRAGWWNHPRVAIPGSANATHHVLGACA